MLSVSDVVDIDPERENAIESFAKENGMVLNRKKKRILMEGSSLAFEGFKLQVRVAKGCKNLDLNIAYDAYLLAKSLGVKPAHAVFRNLLSLVAGLGEQGSGCGPIREKEPPTNIDAAFVVYNDMKSAEFPLHEPIYSAMIRCCSIHDRPHDALKLYRDLQVDNEIRTGDDKIVPKLRTFSPLLTAFAKVKDTKTTHRMFEEMTEVCDLIPTEREYITLLHLAAEQNDSVSFHKYFHDMSDEIQVPTGIHNAYPNSGEDKYEYDVWNVMHHWFSSQPDYKIILSRIAENGDVLGITGERLLSIDLLDDQRLQLLAQLDKFAVQRDETRQNKKPFNNKVKEQKEQKAAEMMSLQSNSEGTIATLALNVQSTAEQSAPTATTTTDSEETVLPVVVDTTVMHRERKVYVPDDVHRQNKWNEYKDFLQSRDGQFDTIVDGANVGYFKQNYLGAPNHVDYFQIDHLLRQLQLLGRKPLLILHCRHVSDHMVPNTEVHDLIHTWENERLIYKTPRGFNDDWFWMYAAVKHNCKVITNDEMRDHHFQLLHPRWFCRWKERHQVHFCFEFWGKQLCGEKAKVVMKNNAGETIVTSGEESTTTDGNSNVADQTKKVDSTDSNSNSDGSEIILDHNGDVLKKDPYSRSISFEWPSLYSHCIQHVVSEKYEGYYCPPVCEEEDDEIGVESALSGHIPEERWFCAYKLRENVSKVESESEDNNSTSSKRQKTCY